VEDEHQLISKIMEIVGSGGQEFLGVEVGIETGSVGLAKKIMPAKSAPYPPEKWPEAWSKISIREVWFKESVERFFRCLKRRTRRFYNNINTWKTQSMEDYAAAIATIRNIHIIMKTQGGVLPG
jgi:hypothetical protein